MLKVFNKHLLNLMEMSKTTDLIVILRNISPKSHNHPRLPCGIHVKVTLNSPGSWSTVRGGGRVGAGAGHVYVSEDLISLPHQPQ